MGSDWRAHEAVLGHLIFDILCKVAWAKCDLLVHHVTCMIISCCVKKMLKYLHLTTAEERSLGTLKINDQGFCSQSQGLIPFALGSWLFCRHPTMHQPSLQGCWGNDVGLNGSI